MDSLNIERLTQYSDHIAAGIGALGPDLSTRFTGGPMARDALEEIIASPYHDQLVATLGERVVGTANMSLILGGISEGRKSWLEDFVVVDNKVIRSMGVGFELWGEIIMWSREKRANLLEFTSNQGRKKAHRFYLRQGAEIENTTVFTKAIRYAA